MVSDVTRQKECVLTMDGFCWSERRERVGRAKAMKGRQSISWIDSGADGMREREQRRTRDGGREERTSERMI